MTNDEFTFWLNGYLSLTDDAFINKQQLIIMRNHADLVAAISGELTQNISNFIGSLENIIAERQQMPLIEIKDLAARYEIAPAIPAKVG
jgi:hypothetical protein